MRLWKRLICLIFIGISAQAEMPTFRSLPYQAGYETAPEEGTGYYIGPNERYPSHAADLFANARSGALIAVGTERALLTAAMFPQITHVIQIDRDPQAVFFNQMNLALLRAAKSRREYWNLRLNAGFIDWLRVAEESKDLAVRSVLSNPVNFVWWQNLVRKNRQFNAFHRAPIKKIFGIKVLPAFEGGHYLYEDAAFRKISTLAKSDRIAVLEMELKDIDRFMSLLDWLDGARIPVSAVDVSNTWWAGYAGPDAITEMAFRLADREKSELRLIYSSWIRPDLRDKQWAYGGVEMTELQTPAKRERFALYLKNMELRMRSIGIEVYEINSLNAFLKSSWRRWVGCDAYLQRMDIGRKF